jgi:hypothetical protein
LVKELGSEGDDFAECSVKVINGWTYTSSSPNAYMARTGRTLHVDMHNKKNYREILKIPAEFKFSVRSSISVTSQPRTRAA